MSVFRCHAFVSFASSASVSSLNHRIVSSARHRDRQVIVNRPIAAVLAPARRPPNELMLMRGKQLHYELVCCARFARFIGRPADPDPKGRIIRTIERGEDHGRVPGASPDTIKSSPGRYYVTNERRYSNGTGPFAVIGLHLVADASCSIYERLLIVLAPGPGLAPSIARVKGAWGSWERAMATVRGGHITQKLVTSPRRPAPSIAIERDHQLHQQTWRRRVFN